jgi:hypothetical protein
MTKRYKGIWGYICYLFIGERCQYFACELRPDNRCMAGLCIQHCQDFRFCKGLCIKYWQKKNFTQEELLKSIADGK